MKLTLDQAAAQLGKSARQIRYMIINGRLPAEKMAGRWFIDSADLGSEPADASRRARRTRKLQTVVDQALGVAGERAHPPCFSDTASPGQV